MKVGQLMADYPIPHFSQEMCNKAVLKVGMIIFIQG